MTGWKPQHPGTVEIKTGRNGRSQSWWSWGLLLSIDSACLYRPFTRPNLHTRQDKEWWRAGTRVKEATRAHGSTPLVIYDCVNLPDNNIRDSWWVRLPWREAHCFTLKWWRYHWYHWYHGFNLSHLVLLCPSNLMSLYLDHYVFVFYFLKGFPPASGKNLRFSTWPRYCSGITIIDDLRNEKSDVAHLVDSFSTSVESAQYCNPLQSVTVHWWSHTQHYYC